MHVHIQIRTYLHSVLPRNCVRHGDYVCAYVHAYVCHHIHTYINFVHTMHYKLLEASVLGTRMICTEYKFSIIYECTRFPTNSLEFRKEGMLDRHALRYLGRTLLTYICTYCIRICTYICTYVRTYEYMYIYKYVLTYVCTYCIQICTYIRT